MIRKQLNQLLLLATQEHEHWYAQYFCGEQSPQTLIKLKQAQSNLQLVRMMNRYLEEQILGGKQ